MDHSKHIRLTEQELTESNLKGAAIYGPEGKIGSVSHTHGSGSAAQVAIDVGGIFGFGAKQVAVPAKDLDFMRDENGEVHALTAWTKDQMKAMPEHHEPG